MPKIPFGLATGNRLNRLSDEVFQGFLDVSLTFFWSQFILKRWGTTRVGGLAVSLLVKQLFSIRKRQLPKKHFLALRPEPAKLPKPKRVGPAELKWIYCLGIRSTSASLQAATKEKAGSVYGTFLFQGVFDQDDVKQASAIKNIGF